MNGTRTREKAGRGPSRSEDGRRPSRVHPGRRCRDPVRGGTTVLAVVAAVVLAGVPASAAAQADGAAGLRGVVVDARSGVPLSGATVSLERLPAGVVTAGTTRSGGFVATTLNVTTVDDGRYAFDPLTPGDYRLRVTRLGYRPATFDVHYDGPADPRISVGLEVEPIELEPVEVRAEPVEPTIAGRSGPQTDALSRVALERSRQDRYLEPDTRVITDADVVEAVTFGEADLLRVLHRLPGVTTEDDFSAEPWTRGSRWDETRIYFDGLPLYDPLHAGGIFTSINPDAVGALTFHPGVRPTDAGDGAAGVVDLRSRSAAGTETTTAFGQLSVVSLLGSFARPWGEGNGISVTGRRTYIEELAAWDTLRTGESEIPYGFNDLSARWDQVLADSLNLEVSGLWTRDRINGDIPNTLKGARGDWGNMALRATLQSTLYGVRARLTVGEAEYTSNLSSVVWDERRQDLDEAATAATTHNRVRSDVTELTVSPVRVGGSMRWQLGARHVRTGIRYAGSAPWPYPDAATAGDLDYSADAARYAYWGSIRRKLHPEVEASAGLRLETSDRTTADLPNMALAPRLAVAWTPRPDLRLSVAAGRHYQYEQAVAATGFTVESGLVPGHLWVSAGNAVPAMRSDMLTAGAELWLAGGWLASVNMWLRSTHGRLSPSPDSGYVTARPAIERTDPGTGWAIGSNSAAGIEAGIRKLAGRWTGSIAASLSRSRVTAAGQTFDAPGQRTFELDAAVLLRASAKTSIGAAFTAVSGAAYTRFYAFRCTAVTWYCPVADAGTTQPTLGFAEVAGGGRTAPYISLDLHVERTTTLFGQPFGFYGQVRNALARNNRAAYQGSVLECDDAGNDCVLRDNFADGFRFIPLIGVWIRT